MWVASYGVMPQAYRVATGPGAARTSSPEAVSWIRGPGVRPGRTGTSALRQESMFVRLSRGKQHAGGEGGDLAGAGGLLEGVGQGDEPRLAPARAGERQAHR